MWLLIKEARNRAETLKSVKWRLLPSDPVDVTGLLLRWGQGDSAALEQLIPHVERELHRIALRCMAGERGGHTLQATALVNEVYMRLVDGKAVAWQDRAHFLAVAARAMRRILVDHARGKQAHKRGGDVVKVSFDEALVVSNDSADDFVALDEALESLAELSPRKSRVIELRFFGGLTIEETASVLDISADTVMRDWRLARAWLQREMRDERQT